MENVGKENLEIRFMLPTLLDLQVDSHYLETGR